MELINVIKEPYSPGKRFGVKRQFTFVLAFLVDRNANKIMIKKAFKAIFGVKVKSVNTLIKHPQPTRMTKYGRNNYTKARKVAYISLTKEDFLSLKKEIEGAEAVEEELLKETQESIAVKSSSSSSSSSSSESKKEIEAKVTESDENTEKNPKEEKE